MNFLSCYYNRSILKPQHLHNSAPAPAAPVTLCFPSWAGVQVLKCNGLPVNNLEDLANAVESCKAKYLRLDLEYNQVVVLDNATAREATKAILETHCIPAAMSEDLRLAVAANNGKTKK